MSKKLTTVGDGTDPNDAVTKRQLDNSGLGDNVSQDIDLKDSYNVNTPNCNKVVIEKSKKLYRN